MARPRAVVLVAFSALFAMLLLRSAWFADDAYVSFRSSLNMATGHGLRWNPDERVQAFTNPLWTMLVGLAMTISREPYHVVMPLHLACTVATLVVLFRLARRVEVAAVSAAALVLSKAFVDFSTSGLENSLSHLLLALFVTAALGAEARSLARLRRVSVAASLAMVNRLDLAVLVGPAVAYEAWSAWRACGTRFDRRRFWGSLFLGFSPIVAWELVAVVYYGFALPNTYYAKARAGLPLVQMLRRGSLYLYNSILVDPATIGAIAVALGCAMGSGLRRAQAIGFGVLLYLGYVVDVGGDFMSGRFLTAPLAASVCLFAALLGMEADREMRASIGRGWVGTLLVLSYAGRFPSLVSDYQGHVEMKDGNGIVDSQREAWPSAGLSGLTLFRPIPDHESVRLGKDLHAHPERVPVWGGVGMAGFYAGSVGHVVDMHALTDALLARLPAPDASHETRDRIGHIIRRIPEGYVETFEKGSNQIKSPELAQYFDALRLVTSAPLFAPSRLRAMFGMWFGAYDPPLNAYLREYDRKAIRPGDLNHGEDHVPSSFYSYWAACADHGVAFTDTGAELELDAPVTTLTLHLENGAYDVTMLRDREWIAASAHYEGETVRLEAAQPFDRVYIDVAHDPARRWTLVSMDVPK